jgi:hypothetical protein
MKVEYQLAAPGAIWAASLAPARKLARLFENGEGTRCGRHEKTVPAADQSLDVPGIGMRVAAGHVVLLADF